MKILLVDDDRGDRAQLARQLGKASFQSDLVQADSITQAIEAFNDGSLDCVMLDYKLPGVDELEGLRKLRALDEFLPIVLVTGFGDELLAAKAMNAGADDYVPKNNLNPQTVSHAVNNAIEKASLRKALAEHREGLESFAHMLSHDLRAPLNQIQYFSELVAEALHEKKYDELDEYAGFITKAAANASNLIRLLTDFLATGKGEAQLEPVDLETLAEDVARIVRTDQTSECTIKIVDLPKLESNEHLLRQILQNLMANGLKYNRSELPQLDISAHITEGQITISIKDNGIGMKEDSIATIFKPFVRLHGDGEFSGSGLGLAICQKNAERLQGSLTVKSELGVGSEFSLTLPYRKVSP